MSDWISGNRFLSQTEMKHNALLVRDRLSAAGFSINAIAAILGNMQTESSINPGIWQDLKPNKGGYGLVQWTPASKYIEWAGSDWEGNGDKECERIAYEFANDIQYAKTKTYPLTASNFKTSDKAPAYLANAFLYNYERPKNLNQPKRGKQAEYWYEFLTGKEPPKPTDPGQPDNPDTPYDPEYPPGQFMGIKPWMLFRFGTVFNHWGVVSSH